MGEIAEIKCPYCKKTLNLKGLGIIPGNYVHGMTRIKGKRNRFYSIWQGMKARCHRKSSDSYHKYGAKGIKVCKRWHTFVNFRDDMHDGYLKKSKEIGEKNVSIHRIDGSKGYEPSNCRWVHIKENSITSKPKKFLTFNGKTKSISAWSKETGITINSINARIALGWKTEKILTTKTKKYNYGRDR